MSGAPLLLGIDDGTTAVKVALFDARLQPLREARRAVPTRHPRPGWVEQDPEAVLAAVVDAVAEVLQDAPGEVAACGLDHQGESVLAWDAGSGTPLTPIVVWQDKRAQGVLERVAGAGHEAAVLERSGLPLDPYFSAGRLAWLLEHDAAVRRAHDEGTLRFGTVDAFLCDRLGGGWATDPSTASRTQLFHLAGGDWDPRLAEIFGVPLSALPPLRDTAGHLGELRHPSWPVVLPLAAQVCDQQAALAGAGCVAPGRVKATYGTGVFVLAHAGDAPPAAVEGVLPTVAWRFAGRTSYALDGGVFTAGAVLEWLARELGVAPDAPAVSALARDAQDAGGVRVLPALAGLGAPWWQPEARGVIAGLDGGTTAAQVARATLEGIAWRVADVVEAVRAHVPVDILRVDGGLTREPLLLELQADACGAVVEAGAADATVAGAAALAGVGAGVIPSLDDLPDLLPVTRRVEPRTDATTRAGANERWRAFVDAASRL